MSINQPNGTANPPAVTRPHYIDLVKEARAGRYKIDTWGALCRNAEAAELEAQRQRFTNRRTYRGGRKEAA